MNADRTGHRHLVTLELVYTCRVTKHKVLPTEVLDRARYHATRSRAARREIDGQTGVPEIRLTTADGQVTWVWKRPVLKPFKVVVSHLGVVIDQTFRANDVDHALEQGRLAWSVEAARGITLEQAVINEVIEPKEEG